MQAKLCLDTGSKKKVPNGRGAGVELSPKEFIKPNLPGSTRCELTDVVGDNRFLTGDNRQQLTFFEQFSDRGRAYSRAKAPASGCSA